MKISQFLNDSTIENSKNHQLFDELKQSTTSLTTIPDIDERSHGILSNELYSITLDKDDVSKLEFIDLLHELSKQTSELTLSAKGYKTKRVICNTLQGELIEAVSIKDSSKRFAIKVTEKKLHFGQQCKIKDDIGYVYTVEEDCIKEAVLLHHCTVANKAIGNYLVSYVDHFESSNYFFLVMEYGGDMNLEQFMQIAHQYILENKLELKVWRRFIKFVTWQLLTLLNWLHSDMNMAHLNLKPENIVLQNCSFIQDKDGMITIDQNLSIKLCDFGLAEAFQNNVDCAKYCTFQHDQYMSPQLFIGDVYNAQKVDIWSLGIILYRLAFFQYPYKFQDSKSDAGFAAIANDKFKQLIRDNDLAKYTNKYMFCVIDKMLKFAEHERLSAYQLCKSKWYQSYWTQYESRIKRKSISQRKQLEQQRLSQRMQNFPFYSL